MEANYHKFTKQGLTLELLAKYFLGLEENSKIKTITDMEEIIDAARGTIQNAIKQLCDVQAITLLSRGKLGTIMIHKDIEKLLSYAGITFLLGVMSLPYSKRYEGLSTAILKTMNRKLSIPVNMAYTRGAQQRIEMILSQRYHFAVVSKFAAQQYMLENNAIEIVVEFNESSYLSSHVLLFGNPENNEIVNGMKIGIDRDSIDQESLTMLATKDKDVTFVDTGYNQLVENIRSGKIDAAIWNGDDSKIEGNQLLTKSIDLNHKDNTIAVIIVDKRRQDLKKIIQSLVDVNEVDDIQQQVLEGNLPPSY